MSKVRNETRKKQKDYLRNVKHYSIGTAKL